MNALPKQAEFRDPLPDAVEAEQCVLGSIFRDNETYWKVAGVLKAHHFTEPLHREVYEIVAKLIEEKRPANPMTVNPYLPAGATIRDKPLLLHVIETMRQALPADGAVETARAVRDTWALRRMIEAARLLDYGARNMTHESSVAGIMSDHAGNMAIISQEISEGTKAVTMADAVDTAMQSISDAYKFKKRAGIATGIEAVDQLTGPWEPGQQIIVGGGTKQGKSALAMQCATGLALHGAVWVYSGEMSVKQLAMREIARRTAIPVWKRTRSGPRTPAGRLGQAGPGPAGGGEASHLHRKAPADARPDPPAMPGDQDGARACRHRDRSRRLAVMVQGIRPQGRVGAVADRHPRAQGDL